MNKEKFKKLVKNKELSYKEYKEALNLSNISDKEKDYNILYFIFNRHLINDKEYETGLKLKEAYDKQKTQDMSTKYEPKINGGKSHFDEYFVDMIDSNEKWNKILKIIESLKELRLIEDFICRNTYNIEKLKTIYKENTENVILNVIYCLKKYVFE